MKESPTPSRNDEKERLAWRLSISQQTKTILEKEDGRAQALRMLETLERELLQRMGFARFEDVPAAHEDHFELAFVRELADEVRKQPE